MKRLIICALLSAVLWRCRADSDPKPIIYPGEVNIALVADLHSPGTDGSSCGPLRHNALRLAMAAVWAVNQMNLRRLSHQASLGLYVYDTCGREDVAQRQLYRLLRYVTPGSPFGCGDQQGAPIFGIIGQGKVNTMETLAKTLGAFSIPLMITSDSTSKILTGMTNVYSTAPNFASLARAVVSTLEYVEAKKVAVVIVTGFSAPVSEFKTEAESREIRIVVVAHVSTVDITSSSINALVSDWQDSVQAVVLFLESSQSLSLLQRNWKLPHNLIWILASVTGMEPISSSMTSSVSFSQRSVLVVSPEMEEMQDLQKFMKQITESKDGTIGTRNLDGSLKFTVFALATKSFHNNSVSGMSKSNEHLTELAIMESVATIKAVWGLAAAMYAVQNMTYENKLHCLRLEQQTLAEDVLRQLSTLRVNIESVQLKFVDNRSLATIKYGIMNITDTGEFRKIAMYTDDEGFEVTKRIPHDILSQTPTENFQKSILFVTDNSVVDLEPATIHSKVNSSVMIRPGEQFVTFSDVSMESKLAEWVKRPWALAVLAIASLGMLFSVYAFVFFLMKVCHGKLKQRNHFLAFLQLFTVAGMYCAAALFTLKPTLLMCVVQRIAHNVTYVGCFGSLLLKALHLRDRIFLGFGGRVSHLSHMLMMLFIVGLQVALEIQWVMTSASCVVTTSEFLMSQIYMGLLLLVVLLATLYVRRASSSRLEAHSLLAMVVVSIIVAGGRTAAFFLVHDAQSRYISLSFGLIVTAAIVYVGVCGSLTFAVHMKIEGNESPASEVGTVPEEGRMPRLSTGSSRRSSRKQESRKTIDTCVADDFEMTRCALYGSTRHIFPPALSPEVAMTF